MEQENLNKEPEKASTSDVIIGLIILIILIFIVIKVLMFLWGAISTSTGNEPKDEITSGVTAEQIQEAETSPLSRCMTVADNLTRRLNDGLNTDGTSLTNLRAVKSNDFDDVHFISGILQGSGLGRETDIVTFVTIGTGLTLSADYVAAEFSDWPNVSTTNFGISTSNDGYSESRKCVSNS